ncbi:Sulfite exporter TauE/SafE [Giardia muris]|uniref:Sulfite exporter TauE/SafE n=1 Tax=Giardia muris TaxID=5742 RepID=A0A4Z1T994_GIAMU|nr:Sulfite exporter TauE/SafE [Giardia muris]|eukprot:TNJ29091.1 Sulfite exporter TauE/SafE [Giardia muris]
MATLVPGLTLGGELGAGAISSVFSILAAASGVGGGVIYVSSLQLFGASAHTAIPLSKIIIFSESFVLMFFNFFQHMAGEPTNPAITWDLVYVIEPAAVAGALIGSFINVLLPEWVIEVLEVVFLVYTAWKMVVHAMVALNQERQAAGKAILCPRLFSPSRAKRRCCRRPKVEAQTSKKEGEDVSTISSEKGVERDEETLEEKDVEAVELLGAVDEEGEEKEDVTVKKASRKKPTKCSGFGVKHFAQIPWDRMTNFIVTTAAILGIEVAVHTVPQCSTWYWVGMGSCMLVSILAVILNTVLIRRSIRKYQRLVGEGVEHSEAILRARILIGSDNPDAFNKTSYYVRFALVGLGAGVLGAVLGVGGGLLKNPILLTFGIDPVPARTASSTMIAFTSLSSSISYLLLGSIKLVYAWPLMLGVGFFFVSGYFVGDALIRCVRTKAFVPFLLAVMMLASAIFIAVTLSLEIKEMVETGLVPGFGSVC